MHLLQETGIGRTVNGLCKSDNGEVRTAAKSLVNKWKALVVNESEDEPARQSQEEDSAGVVAKHKDEGRMKKERSHQHHHRKISSKKDSDSKRDRDRGDEATESIRSDSKKSMDKHAHHKENNSHDRHGSSPEKKHESRKRSGEENKERSTKRQRAEGQHRSKRESEEDCEDTEIDGSAGTSFADALAMMDGGGGTTAKSSKSSSSGNPSKAPTSTAMSNSTRRSDPATHTKGTTSDNSSRLASSSSSAGYSKVEAKAGGSRSSRPSDSGSGPPKLLAPSTKLAPLLDPEELKKDILGPSVVISNSYTPTSYLNPVNIAGVSASIMKNKRPVGQPPPPVVDSNNFEILQSKARTKVYSGNKGAAVVLSLHEMCIRVLQKNVDALEYTGGVPYDILEPILLKCSASQLDQIEYYNPYLGEDTNDLWKIHTQRQFRGKKRQEMESWREMYQVSDLQLSAFQCIMAIFPNPPALSTGGAGASLTSDRVDQTNAANFDSGEADEDGLHGPGASAADGTSPGNWRRWRRAQHQCVLGQSRICQWHANGFLDGWPRGAGQTGSANAEDTGAHEEGDQTVDSAEGGRLRLRVTTSWVILLHFCFIDEY